MEMKTVGEGGFIDCLYRRGGGGGEVVVGCFLFFASRALQTRLEKK